MAATTISLDSKTLDTLHLNFRFLGEAVELYEKLKDSGLQVKLNRRTLTVSVPSGTFPAVELVCIPAAQTVTNG